MNQEGLNYLDNLSVRQSRIHKGDVRWFVQSANGWVIRGPKDTRGEAQAELDEIRQLAWEEHEEEMAELREGSA